MLDVRRLRVLREVAAAGSVSGAAANLGYTHSAISQQLSALERETATKLIERNGRTVRLTHAAEVLIAHTTTVLTQLERAEADLAAARDEVAGQVRIASFPTASTALLPSTLVALREQYPSLDVRLVDMEPEESLPALRHREVDIALVHHYDLIADDDLAGLHEVDLFTEPVLLVLRSGEGASPPGGLVAYADHPWIVPYPDSTCGLLVERACASAGFEPRAVARVHDFGTAAALAAAGVGVTLIPQLGYTNDPRLVAQPVSQPLVTRHVSVVARAGSETHPALNAVLTSIEWHARRLGDELSDRSSSLHDVSSRGLR